MGTFHALSAAKASVFSHLAYATSLVVMGKYVFAIAFPNAAKGITMNPEKMAIRARNMCYKFNAFTERHEQFFAGRDNKATLERVSRVASGEICWRRVVHETAIIFGIHRSVHDAVRVGETKSFRVRDVL